MEIATLENWLWDAACSVRGPLDAPKYRDYILPLLFYKRLSDVYQDELARHGEELGSSALARDLAERDRKLVRFFIPNGFIWAEVRKSPVRLGERLTEAMREIAKENPKLAGVIDVVDFNATAAGQRILDDDALTWLMEILNRQRLGLRDVDPDILGRAYEYLLRKFSEGSGQSAGEFYTPMPIATLMARILDPQEGETIYDPCCGSGGLLIKAQLRLREKVAEKLGKVAHDLRPEEVGRPLQLFGQEIMHSTYAMCKMNAFVHDMEAEIALGDTMKAPRFVTEDGGLRTFEKVTANPMWNQRFGAEVYENDAFDRFAHGTPPSSSADWGWIQHMLASLGPAGKMAVVLDTGAVSRGSGNQGSNRERDVRRSLVEGNLVIQGDLIEAVILLPENMFYNTSAPGIILVVNRAKDHPGEVLLINAAKLCEKGRPKNFLTDEHVAQIHGVYEQWRAEEGISAIITAQEAARNDYNVSPSRYVARDDVDPPLPLEEALVLLAQAEEARAKANAGLDAVLAGLGFADWRST